MSRPCMSFFPSSAKVKLYYLQSVSIAYSFYHPFSNMASFLLFVFSNVFSLTLLVRFLPVFQDLAFMNV